MKRVDHTRSSRKRLSHVLSMAAIGLAALTSCTDENPQALVGSAKTYLAKKDVKAAVIQLKSALQKEPRLAEARFLLGHALLDGGDAVSAEVELRKALDYKYDEAEVVPLLARALIAEGKGQQVVQAYASTELSKPEATADLKTSLAIAYLQRSATAKGQASLDDALRVVPDYAPALLIQARLKATSDDFDGAFAILDKVLERDPRNHEALQLKGDLLYLAKGDAKAALEALRGVLAIRPDWIPARFSMLGILLAQHDFPAAKTQLDEVKKFLPNHPQTRYFEAQLAYQNKDYKTAKELSQRLLKDAPDNPKALLLAGTLEFQSGSIAQAEALVLKALQQAPGVDATRRVLAQIYLRSGQLAKAKETLAPLIDKPNVSAETLSLLAQAELQSGNAAKAEAYFSRAAKLDPNDTRSRTALALGQFSKGNKDLGFSQLQEIASSDKGVTADMALISAKMRQRDYDGALKAIDALEKKQPDKPFAAMLRGQIQLARKDVGAARLSFVKAQSIDPMYFPAAASLAALEVQDGKFDDARHAFDKLLAADPKNVQTLVAVAELRARAGAGHAEVAQLLAEATKLNPTVPTPRLLLVDLHLRSKDWKAALAAAQDGAAALPDNPVMLDALGRAQLASGDSNQAIASFKKVANFQQQSPQPYVRLGGAYLALKDYNASRENLNRALAIAPKFLPAQQDLMRVELAAGKPEQAMTIARTVQSERPDQGVGYTLAGDVESIRNNWDAAAMAYRASLKREASADVAAKLHHALRMAQKPGEADTVAATWVKQHPDDVVLRGYLGDLALKRPDLVAAESQYLAVANLQPDNAMVLNNLAWITHKLKKPGAARYAERANALWPNQPAFMDTLAVIMSDSGRLDKALELEKRALSISPEFHAARLNLAKIYLKAGKSSAAREELDRLKKLGPQYPDQAEVGELLKSI